jgi:hypothetical protein
MLIIRIEYFQSIMFLIIIHFKSNFLVFNLIQLHPIVIIVIIIDFIIIQKVSMLLLD